MHQFVLWLGQVLPTFLLVLARTLGLMLQAPVIGNRNLLPAPVRMSIAVLLSLIAMMLLPGYPQVPDVLLPFVLMLLTEFMLGALFGFAASFLFMAAQSAGELFGVQAGMSFASTMNPLLHTQVNAFGTLYQQIGYILFLVVGGHLWMIRGFMESFQLVPLGTFILRPVLAQQFIEMSGTFLAITVQLALPAVLVLFLSDLAVGYMAKSAPQSQSITQELVMTLKPYAGLLLLVLVMPNIASVLTVLTEQMIRNLDLFLRLSAPH